MVEAVLDSYIFPPRRGEMKRSMEALIHHFKLYTEGTTCRCFAAVTCWRTSQPSSVCWISCLGRSIDKHRKKEIAMPQIQINQQPVTQITIVEADPEKQV